MLYSAPRKIFIFLKGASVEKYHDTLLDQSSEIKEWIMSYVNYQNLNFKIF